MLWYRCWSIPTEFVWQIVCLECHCWAAFHGKLSLKNSKWWLMTISQTLHSRWTLSTMVYSLTWGKLHDIVVLSIGYRQDCSLNLIIISLSLSLSRVCYHWLSSTAVLHWTEEPAAHVLLAQTGCLGDHSGTTPLPRGNWNCLWSQ